MNNSDSVVNCVSTTPSSLSSTTSPVQVDSHTALSSLKTMAQKAIDQAGIDVPQQTTDSKSNYQIVFLYINLRCIVVIIYSTYQNRKVPKIYFLNK